MYFVNFHCADDEIEVKDLPKVTKLLSRVDRTQTPNSCSYPCVYSASM